MCMKNLILRNPEILNFSETSLGCVSGSFLYFSIEKFVY